MPPKRKWVTANKFLEKYHDILEKQKNPQIGSDLLKKTKEGGTTALTKEESHVFWRNVHDNFVAHLHSLIPDDPESEPIGKDDSIEFLNVVFSLLHQLMEEREPNVENFSSQIFIVLIGMLKNDCINEEIKLQIVKISEEWCRRKLLLYNSAIVHTFEFLLEISLKRGATKADVRRACGLRSAVKLENNIPKNRQRFLDAMRNINYLTTKEGCRFLTLILTLEEELTKEMHSVCKAFLPECTKNIAKAYGEIYYAAWSVAEGAMRKTIEEHLIQDFMERILKLKRQALEMSPLGQKVLTLLHAFHSHKSVTHVRTMLATLYEPLLWRNLKSPDTTIRSNAAEVFLDAYPLEKRGEGREKNVEYTEKQHKIMTELLTDKCHIVRIIAVRHICQIASVFWQAIPPEVIQQWLSIVVTQLSRDSSCAEVRRSVFRGMRALVVNPLCAEYMQKVLPHLQDSIHDTNARVRTAFVEMLVACKKVNSIKFWSIVPLNHLLARLEVDDREVGQKIVKLLFESFYPYERGPEVTLKRIMKMIVLSPIGSRKFFFYSKSVLSFDSSVQLVLSVMTYILRHVRTEVAGKLSTLNDTEQGKAEKRSTTKRHLSTKGKKTSKKRKMNSPDSAPSPETKESEQTEEATDESDLYFKTSLENPLISEILIDIVSILLTVHNPKQHNDEYKEQWKKIYAMCKTCIPEFLRFYKGTRTYNSVLYLSTMMPRSVRKSIRPIFHLDSTCLSQLKSLPVHSTDEEVLRLVTILCAWNRGDELLEMTKNWIDEALRAEDLNSTRYGEPRSERRKVKILEAREPNPVLGFRVLNAIFTYPPNNLIIMSKHYGQIVDIWKYLERVKKLIENRVERTSFFDNYLLSDEFIIECFSRYLKLIPNIKLGSENQSFDSVAALNNVLEWSEKVLISCLPKEFPLTSDDSTVEWVLIDTLGPVLVSLLNEVLKASANFIILNQTTVKLTYKIIRYCKLLLRNGCRVMFVYCVCGVMCAISDKYKKMFKGKDLALLYSSMANLLVDCAEAFTDTAFTKDGLKQHVVNFSEARTSMINTLLSILKIFGPSNVVFCKTVSQIVTAITVIITKDSELLEDLVALKKVQELPYVASQLMTSFYNNKNLSEVTFQALVKNICGEYREVPKQLLAAFGLLLLFVRYRRFISVDYLKNALTISEAAVLGFHAQMSKEEVSEDDDILLEMMVEVLNEARSELTTPRKDMQEKTAEAENAGGIDCEKSDTECDNAAGQTTKPRKGKQKQRKKTNLKKVSEEKETVDAVDNGEKECDKSKTPHNKKNNSNSDIVTRSSKRRNIPNELADSRKNSEDVVGKKCEESEIPCKNKNNESSELAVKSGTGGEKRSERSSLREAAEGNVTESEHTEGTECEKSETPRNNKNYESDNGASKSSSRRGKVTERINMRGGMEEEIAEFETPCDHKNVRGNRIGKSSRRRRKVTEISSLRKEMDGDAVGSEGTGSKESDEAETPRNSKSYESVTNSDNRRRKVAEITNLRKEVVGEAVTSECASGKVSDEAETPNNNKRSESGNRVTKSSSRRGKVSEKTNLRENIGGEIGEFETPRNSKNSNSSNSINKSNSRKRKVTEVTSLRKEVEGAATGSESAEDKESDDAETPHNSKSCESGNSISNSDNSRREVAEVTNLRKEVDGDAAGTEGTGSKESDDTGTPRNSKTYESGNNITKSSNRKAKITEKTNLMEDMEKEVIESETPCNNKNSNSSNSINKSNSRRRKVTEVTSLRKEVEGDAIGSESAEGKESLDAEAPRNSKSCESVNSISNSDNKRRKVAEVTKRKEVEVDAAGSEGTGNKESDEAGTPRNSKSYDSDNSIAKSSNRRAKVTEITNFREDMEKEVVKSETPHNNKNYTSSNSINKSNSRRQKVTEVTSMRQEVEEDAVGSEGTGGKASNEAETPRNSKSYESGKNTNSYNKRRKVAEITNLREKVDGDAVGSKGIGSKESDEAETPGNSKNYESGNIITKSGNRRRKVAEITNLRKGTIEEIFEIEDPEGKKRKVLDTLPKGERHISSQSVLVSSTGRRRLSELTNIRIDMIEEVTKSGHVGVKKCKDLGNNHKDPDSITKPSKRKKM